MKFISTWTIPQGTFNAAVARFLETGGPPPEGVKILGRWHGMSGQGFAVSESTDPKERLAWKTPTWVRSCRRFPSVDLWSEQEPFGNAGCSAAPRIMHI
jgi:hypothetical protein